MSPTMWPSSTCRFTPSSARVVPKALRRPRASMHAMASGLLLWGIRLRGQGLGGIRGRGTASAVQKLFHLQAEPLDGGLYPGPFLAEELLPFGLQQQAARTTIDEHAQAAPGLDEPLLHQ